MTAALHSFSLHDFLFRSSFKAQHMSSNICLMYSSLGLPVPFFPYIAPSTIFFNRQLCQGIWPIIWSHLLFRCFMKPLSSNILLTTTSFVTMTFQMIFIILLQHQASKANSLFLSLSPLSKICYCIMQYFMCRSLTYAFCSKFSSY